MLFFAGYIADLRAHSRQRSSSFCTLIMAFLFANALGRGMCDEPLSGSYFAIFKYNLMQWAISKPDAVFVNFSIQFCKYAI